MVIFFLLAFILITIHTVSLALITSGDKLEDPAFFVSILSPKIDLIKCEHAKFDLCYYGTYRVSRSRFSIAVQIPGEVRVTPIESKQRLNVVNVLGITTYWK
jgi:hypothetical protein